MAIAGIIGAGKAISTALNIIPGVAGLIRNTISKAVANPDERAKLEAGIDMKELELELEKIFSAKEALLTELRSKDKWVSRARPSFLYVVYALFLTAIPVQFIGMVFPTAGINGANTLTAYLHAFPEPLYWIFGTGFLGYAGSRTIDKGLRLVATHKQK